MRQFWVVAGICLMIISLVKTQDPPTANDIEITKLQKNGTTTDVYITELPGNTTRCILLIKPENEPEVVAGPTSVTPGAESVNFDFNITSTLNTDITFVINALKDGTDEPIAAGEAKVTVPKELPEVLKGSIGENPEPDDDVGPQLLRVVGDLKTFTLDIGTGSVEVVEEGSVVYYFGEINGTEFDVCTSSEPPTPLLCVEPITAVSVTISSDMNVNEATLKYTNKTNANVTAVVTPTGEDVNENPPTEDKLDIIFLGKRNKKTKLCADQIIGSAECIIEWGAGDATADIRLVEVDAKGNITKYHKNPIQDRDLHGVFISETTIEAMWFMADDIEKKYQITAYDATPSEVGDPITVDCIAFGTLTHCYGYFNDVENTIAYTVKVQDFLNEDFRTDRQIQSLPISYTPLIELQIQKVHLEWHQNGIEANASICFQPIFASDVESVFSHYEVVIINGKGQWLKDILMTLDTDEGDLCFTPLTINTETFDVTEGAKAIVIQRAIDGFSVLSSGETTLF